MEVEQYSPLILALVYKADSQREPVVNAGSHAPMQATLSCAPFTRFYLNHFTERCIAWRVFEHAPSVRVGVCARSSWDKTRSKEHTHTQESKRKEQKKNMRNVLEKSCVNIFER